MNRTVCGRCGEWIWQVDAAHVCVGMIAKHLNMNDYPAKPHEGTPMTWQSERIAALEAERELTINTLELMGKGLAYENVTKAKTQSAGRALMEIARKLRGGEE